MFDGKIQIFENLIYRVISRNVDSQLRSITADCLRFGWSLCTGDPSLATYSARNWAFPHTAQQLTMYFLFSTLMTAVIVYYVKFGGWWRLKGVPCVVVGGWHFWHKCLRVWEGRRSRVECLPWFWKEQKGGGVGVANPLPSSLLSLANQLAQLNQVCMLCRITNGVNKWLVFSLPSSSPHLLWVGVL